MTIGTRNIVAAMEAENVSRFIGLATPSVADERDQPTLKARVLPSLRAGYLGRDKVGSAMSRADIAAFLVAQLTDDTFSRAAPAISN